MQQMQTLKQHYRNKYESLKGCRVEVEYCTRLVDQCRQKLMQEFETWYDSLYGSQIAECDGNISLQSNPLSMSDNKFKLDKLTNKESYTYYKAKKNIEKKAMRTFLRGKHQKMPPIPNTKTVTTLI